MAITDIQFSIMFFAASEETLRHDKYRLVLAAARFADRNGFSSIWIPERHFAVLGGLYPNPSVLHAALAMVTQRIRLRAGSVVLPLHHPIRVAEEWSLVDNLSRGRIGISFASGWNPDDFAFFPEKYEERWEELFRVIPIVKKLWQGEPLTVTNGLAREVDVSIYPRPVQRDLPIWVTAARSPATFIKAGEIGANVLTHLLDQDLEEVARKISLYREARGRHGHDPQAGLVTMMLHTFVGEDADLVREQGRKPYCDFLKSNVKLLKALAESRDRHVDLESLPPEEKDDFVNFLYARFASTRSLIGTPETCFDLVVRLRAMGVDEIACLLDFGPPYDLVLQNLNHLNRLKEVCMSDGFRRSVAQLEEGGSQANRARQTVEIETEAPSGQGVLQDVRNRCAEGIPGSEFYRRLQEFGLDVHPSIRGVQQIWRRDGEALGEVELRGLKPGNSDEPLAALLDSCVQVSLAALPLGHAPGSAEGLYLPWELAKVDIRGPLRGRLFSHALLTSNLDGSGQQIEGEVRILSPNGELLAGISRLQLRKPPFAPATGDTLEDWFYELRWEEKAGAAKPSMDPSTAWLILADKGGLGHAFARLLEERGHQTVLIDRERLMAAVNHEAAEAEALFQKLEPALRNALDQVAGRRCAVVFMWSIDSVSPEEMTESSLQADQVTGPGCALLLIQLIAGLQGDPLPQLWLVTRGGQPVDGESRPLQIAQAPLWGLGRTCTMEHPELRSGIVDLDPEAANEENATYLLETVVGEGGEDQVAFRHGKAFVPRLVRSRRLNPEPFALRADAGYLITGGLKGIGFEVARWLVRKGARHLYLLGRSSLPARDRWDELQADSADLLEIRKIRALEDSGAEVVYAAVDVANQTEMTAFMKRLNEQGRCVRGVIHAASVWRDERGRPLIRPLAKLDRSSLEEVFRPKVLGSWLLHRAFENIPLDFFVCFSSAASLTGSAGQGNYAAASVFLDALAYYRVRAGQRAVSINWGPVSGAGFGATPEGLKVHEYWAANGIKRISVEQLLQVLERLIPHSPTQLGVMNVDWEKLGRFFPALGKAGWARHLIESLKSEERSEFVQRILEVPADERQELLVRRIREEVAAVMGLRALPDARKKLFEMGMDSLMALELKNRLQKSLATEIRVTAMFNYPTIDALSEYLLQTVLPQVVRGAVREAPAGPVREESALSRIKALSDEEVDRLFEVKARKRNPLP